MPEVAVRFVVYQSTETEASRSSPRWIVRLANPAFSSTVSEDFESEKPSSLFQIERTTRLGDPITAPPPGLLRATVQDLFASAKPAKPLLIVETVIDLLVSPGLKIRVPATAT